MARKQGASACGLYGTTKRSLAATAVRARGFGRGRRPGAPAVLPSKRAAGPVAAPATVPFRIQAGVA